MTVQNPQVSTQQFDFVQGNLQTRWDYDANNNLAYEAWAAVGVATSDPYWRIVKNNYILVGATYYLSFTSFPQDANGNPSCGFAFVWDNRATYSYS